MTRGIRDGIVTTRYPRRRDDYGPSFRATVTVNDPRDNGELPEHDAEAIVALCPTAAIRSEGGRFRLDRGRCIACGRCVVALPDVFSFARDIETAELRREVLVVPPAIDELAALEALRAELGTRVRALRRSVHVRHVDCGSDGSEEWEIAALTNPVYDVQRLGIYFTASPRHADLLLVTGAGAAGMLGPLATTFESMPDPKLGVAVGTDALSG
ncbi:MAG TPA: ferredoxin, partial [Acidimicrobiales bacterium]|nr:ferredoxin [Acidimicrobiales bacterium]